MEHEISFHDDYAEVRAWGKASLQGFIGYVKEAMESPEWKPGMNVLIDLSGVEGHDTGNITFRDSEKFAAFLKKNIERIGNPRYAVIPGKGSESDLLVGLHETLADFYGMERSSRVFRDPTEAIAWLRQG